MPRFPNIRQLEQLGVEVTYRQGNLSDISYHLSNNQPCLVPVETGELPYWDESTLHAVLVIGQDDDNVYLNDPGVPKCLTVILI